MTRDLSPSRWSIIDRPHYVSPERYDEALHAMTDRLRVQPGVRAVYQIGGVSTPGISDLDMVVVFDDGARGPHDFTRDLSADENYLFIHQLYGSSVSLFRRAQRSSFFHNYRLLHGEDLLDGALRPSPQAEQQLKQQIALEYLIKMYINVVLQREYRTLKLRSFLLHAKAIAYDLNFLSITSGTLYDMTHRIIEWRARWFEAPPSRAELLESFQDYSDQIEQSLCALLRTHAFAWGRGGSHRVARSITLMPGPHLRSHRRGFRLPAGLGVLGSRFVKLQNRLNRFVFEVPVEQGKPPAALAERYALVRDMQAHKAEALPGFAVLTSSLGIA